jgi:hypothetical protein
MPEYCTCGAQLPEEALFCHKCGKPQREIVEPEPVAPPPEPLTAPPQAQARPEITTLSFRNPIAIRIAITAAGVATLLSFLPYLNWLAAGFFAVFFYRRRTGALLTMESGVRMGWMTGVMMFAMMALLLTLSLLFFQAAGGIAAVQAEFKNAVDPRVLEALKTLQSGPEVFRLLVTLFVFTTLLSMAGGAIGAKMTGRS